MTKKNNIGQFHRKNISVLNVRTKKMTTSVNSLIETAVYTNTPYKNRLFIKYAVRAAMRGEQNVPALVEEQVSRSIRNLRRPTYNKNTLSKSADFDITGGGSHELKSGYIKVQGAASDKNQKQQQQQHSVPSDVAVSKINKPGRNPPFMHNEQGLSDMISSVVKKSTSTESFSDQIYSDVDINNNNNDIMNDEHNNNKNSTTIINNMNNNNATKHHRQAGEKAVPQKRRVKFSRSEVTNLYKGVRRHGVGNWTNIINDATLPFHDCRTSGSLKDKWRNLNR